MGLAMLRGNVASLLFPSSATSPVVPYFTLETLSALIPLSHLTEGLDDDGDGVEEAFTKVQTAVENRVNGMLSARYAVPISSTEAGVLAFLADVCTLMAAAMVMSRRGIPAEQWAFKGDHSAATARLRAIAKGDEPLSHVTQPANDASVIISADAGSYTPGISA